MDENKNLFEESLTSGKRIVTYKKDLQATSV